MAEMHPSDREADEPRTEPRTPMDTLARAMDKRPGADGQSIGHILVEAGRLERDDAEIVLREQQTKGGNFGSTALSLGLVSQADVDFALARQYDYPYLSPNSGLVQPEVVAAYQPFGAVAEQLRTLRSQLALRWLQRGRVERPSLAVTGVGRGEGRSFVAANLAVMFAQAGARTLLIDADLRHPSQHGLFRLDNRRGLSTLLAGRGAGEVIVPVAGLSNLFTLPAGPVPPNPQELITRHLARQLRALEPHFEVLITDTSAAASGADGQLVAAESGATLLVVRQDATPLADLRAFHGALQAAGSRVLGAVVNR
jgi:protein-tyrosine kinase